jgi:hypothetical protein
LDRGVCLVGFVALILGLVPVALPLAAGTVAGLLPGCSVNEAGSTGACRVLGRPAGDLMAAAYGLIGAIPAGLGLSLIGFFLLLTGWGIRRARTRRAQHR